MSLFSCEVPVSPTLEERENYTKQSFQLIGFFLLLLLFQIKRQDIFLLTVITEAFGLSQLSSHVDYIQVIKQ